MINYRINKIINILLEILENGNYTQLKGYVQIAKIVKPNYIIVKNKKVEVLYVNTKYYILYFKIIIPSSVIVSLNIYIKNKISIMDKKILCFIP